MSDSPAITLSPAVKGEPVTAAKWNEHVTAINTLRKGVHPPAQIFPERKAGTVTVALFQVVSVQTDYLVCNPLDGATGVASTDVVNVALPYLLRRTPFDGSTREGISYTYTSNIQRTASDGSDTETQVIVPSYAAGDSIFAMRGVLRGTGAVLVDGNNNTTALDWIDMNFDGRAWAKDDS